MVAIDGSEHSNRALNEAINLSKMAEGSITLIHVYPNSLSRVLSSEEQSDEALKEKGEAVLDGAKKMVESKGVSVDTLLFKGDVVNHIVRTAKDGKYDLIVVGARGLSKLEELVLGSISHGVIEKAPCPVIVTR